jgi:branched-subunit amino acid aminotransferase/4-amino-4-deoxychorismate lyase
MDTSICYNGEFFPESELILTSANRAFRYGDGLFETIRMQDGHLFFIDDHFERIIAGMFALGLDTTLFNPLQICQEILVLCDRKELRNARIRLAVFRNDGGAYCPVSDTCSYLITADPLSEPVYQLNEKGLRLGLYTEIRKPINALSGIKTANSLIYVLAARFAREQNWDDAILLNEHGRVCEATSSNLFIVLPDKRILTPPATEGILPGVLRKNLLSWLRANGYQIEEAILLTEDFYRAEEVFITNVIHGIRWAISFRERRFFSRVARELTVALNQKVAV